MHNRVQVFIAAACTFAGAARCLGQDASPVGVLAQSGSPVSQVAGKIDSVRLVAGTYFYLHQSAGSTDDWSLMVRPADGSKERTLLDPAALTQAGKAAVIFDIEPSWDGRYVAIGASSGRSEGAFIRIVDVATGKLLKDVIPRSFDGDASWADDNKSFYYRQVKELPAGSPRAAAFEDMRAYVHRLGDDVTSDKPIFGPNIVPELHLPARCAINAFPVPGTSLVLAVQSSSVTELDSFWVRDLSAKNVAWRQIIDHKDQVLFEFALRGAMLYFVTKKASPNGTLMAFDIAKEDISSARTVLPASNLILSERDEDGVAGASDALYVYGRRNGTPELVRVPYDTPSASEQVKLPVPGSISDVSSDYRKPGVLFTLGGQKQPTTTYVYDPLTKQLTDTQLQPR